MYGSINDDELLTQSKHLWWCFFDLEKETGFDDNGFKNAKSQGVKVFTPVSNHNFPLYKAHAKYKIKVENVIADFKDFQILKPNHMCNGFSQAAAPSDKVGKKKENPQKIPQTSFE
jgi:hypothetical protein